MLGETQLPAYTLTTGMVRISNIRFSGLGIQSRQVQRAALPEHQLLLSPSLSMLNVDVFAKLVRNFRKGWQKCSIHGIRYTVYT